MGLLLILLLVLLCLGGLPMWGHGGLGYGWWPSGTLGLLLIVLLVLVLSGRL